jgi:alkanesulfonate monooxygenase SsuD/methylene tetrahydromethanopterin reductase-like flavin-dependent oxidoreductase (luciferase family)
MSRNRFVLGIGTGSPGSNPSGTIDAMMAKLESIRNNFGKMTNSPGLEMPETYVATLRSGIARKVAGKSEGILLNFCSPEYAKKVVHELSTEHKSRQIDFACYLKVFYARDQRTADRLLIEEFARYDSIGHYHEMFGKYGVDLDIQRAKETLKADKASIPNSLLRISLSNPSVTELKNYVDNFREAGITLPCIYPYFSNEDNLKYREQVIRSIVKSL